jgi:hypothetical protein
MGRKAIGFVDRRTEERDTSAGREASNGTASETPVSPSPISIVYTNKP